MRDRSVFISSCSRRDLARRRPTRAVARMWLALTLLVFVIALGAVIAARGGL
jgi:hypothetical protein